MKPPTTMPSETDEVHAAYWRDRLDGAPVAEIPNERGSGRRSGVLAPLAVPILATLAGAVRHLGAEVDASVEEVLAAALAILLARFAREADVVVGLASPSTGELFPMRVVLTRAITSRELILRVRDAAFDAQRHRLTLRAITGASTEPKAARSIFTVALITSSTPLPELDLALFVDASKEELTVELRFDSSLFDDALVARMAAHLVRLLESMCSEPDGPARSRSVFDEAERRRLVSLSSGPTFEYPFEPVDEIILEQAVRRADVAAIEQSGRSVTFRELVEHASQLAHWLKREVPERNEVIGVFIERSPELVIAELAIWMAGHAYVPLAEPMPEGRAAWVLGESRARLVLCSTSTRDALARAPCAVVVLDTLSDALAAEPRTPPPRAARPADLAYIIFTSGSTGTPKGVQIHHGGLSNYCRQTCRKYGFLPDDRFAHQGSPAFDVSVGVTWVPLAGGATLVMVNEELLLSPPRFVRWLGEQRITRCGMPASLFEACLEEDFGQTRLRTVGTGLEKLHEIDKSLPFSINHGYGPTETTVGASWLLGVKEFPSPIGRPNDNYRIYILDDDLELLPHGALGEGYIAGAGVGRGYLRPGVTAERFLPDPFGPPGSRMYRTGDVLRWRSDEQLEFRGRVDHQVKIRGYRVEAGEIESALNAHPMVRESIVVPVGASNEVPRLVAYVAARAGTAFDLEILRTEIAAKLPDYMVPSAYVVLAGLPLTPNGKVDRKALPAPDFGVSSQSFVAPSTTTQELIASVWQAVLGLPRIGINDDFFALGAHSLHIARVSSGLHAAGIDVGVAQIFKTPTVRGLAAVVDSGTLAVSPPMVRMGDVAARASFVQEVLAAWESVRAPSCTWSSTLRLALRGELDADALGSAISSTLDANEVLRWGYDQRSGVRVLAAADVACERHDLSAATAAEVDAFCAKQGNAAPFVFDGGPLVRFFVLARGEGNHELLVVWHAFVHDPMHGQLLFDEIFSRYVALVEGGPEPSPPHLRYVDYAMWERAWFDGPGAADVVAARKSLEGASVVDVAEHPRIGPVSTAATSKWFPGDAQAFAKVEHLAKSLMVTPFMVFTALTAAWLSRWSGIDDVSMISPVNLRNLRPELEKVVGRFGNWIPIRISTAGDPTFGELVGRAKVAVIDAHLHESAPVARVLDSAAVFDHPLSRIILNTPVIGGTSAPTTRTLGRLTITTGRVPELSGARNDLAVVLGTADRVVFGGVRGADDLFRPETVATQSAALLALARALDPSARLSRLR